MPINKNAYIRYQVLDNCFSNFGKKYFIENLLDEVNNILQYNNGGNSGIGRTQLFKDIRFMESQAGFSVDLDRKRDGKKVYYRYSDKDFSIRSSPLTTTEVSNIKSALLVLSRFKGLPQFEWLTELLPVLNDRLGILTETKHVIHFDSNIDYIGIPFIEPIYQAIINKTVLKIKYKDFATSTIFNFVLHPYILRQFSNRWYVLGLNEDKNVPTWILALDRIISVDGCSKKYLDTEIDWENDFFYDIIGVTRYAGEVPQKIVLQFTADLWPYIQTKPIHPTQSKPKLMDNGEVQISIKVIPNYELESLILSHGEKVKVISPDTLANTIRKRVEKLKNRY